MPEDFAQSGFFCMMPHNVKACLLQCELESICTFIALETQSTSKNVGSLAEVGNLVCRHRLVEMVQLEAEEEVLPPEANATLFLSGLPLDITKREVAHILRPFEGFKVSLVPRFSSHCDQSCGFACVVSLGDLCQMVFICAPCYSYNQYSYMVMTYTWPSHKQLCAAGEDTDFLVGCV